jgi:LmbE family N-acetylglucosaminyl deacetylase
MASTDPALSVNDTYFPLRLHCKLLLRRIAHVILKLTLRARSQAYQASCNEIIIVAPHQDDESLGCAGLIVSMRKRAIRVSIIFLTDGAGSHPGHPSVTPLALRSLRRQEALAAATVLGVAHDAITFMELPDGSLANLSAQTLDEACLKIASILPRNRKSEVFVPYRYDGSSEHEAAFTLVATALRCANNPAKILQYPVWSWWSPRLLWRLVRRRENIRHHNSHEPKVKHDAIRCYQSQCVPTPPWHQPVLPTGFCSFFASSTEYFIEHNP